MGQPSLPILNKVGHSMYWNACWDDQVNFQNFFLVEMFLKKFFLFFFEDKIVSIFFKNFFNHKYFIDFNQIDNERRVTRVPVYTTSVWLLKFQNWCVISLYLYIPKVFLTITDNYRSLYWNKNLSLKVFLTFFKKNNWKFKNKF